MTIRQSAGIDAMHHEPTLCGWTRATREDVLHYRLKETCNRWRQVLDSQPERLIAAEYFRMSYGLDDDLMNAAQDASVRGTGRYVLTDTASRKYLIMREIV
jgi:hypothetical protein